MVVCCCKKQACFSALCGKARQNIEDVLIEKIKFISFVSVSIWSSFVLIFLLYWIKVWLSFFESLGNKTLSFKLSVSSWDLGQFNNIKLIHNIFCKPLVCQVVGGWSESTYTFSSISSSSPSISPLLFIKKLENMEHEILKDYQNNTAWVFFRA